MKTAPAITRSRLTEGLRYNGNFALGKRDPLSPRPDGPAFTENYLACTTWQDVHKAISVLAVRGAPAIGVAAAYGVVLGARSILDGAGGKPFLTAVQEICTNLDGARPTAVNLHWALEQMMDCAKEYGNESPSPSSTP